MTVSVKLADSWIIWYVTIHCYVFWFFVNSFYCVLNSCWVGCNQGLSDSMSDGSEFFVNNVNFTHIFQTHLTSDMSPKCPHHRVYLVHTNLVKFFTRDTGMELMSVKYCTWLFYKKIKILQATQTSMRRLSFNPYKSLWTLCKVTIFNQYSWCTSL